MRSVLRETYSHIRLEGINGRGERVARRRHSEIILPRNIGTLKGIEIHLHFFQSQRKVVRSMCNT